jgi:hypothetical protein
MKAGARPGALGRMRREQLSRVHPLRMSQPGNDRFRHIGKAPMQIGKNRLSTGPVAGGFLGFVGAIDLRG